jgi:hypothetical protein
MQMECIKRISVAEVLDACREMLGSRLEVKELAASQISDPIK